MGRNENTRNEAKHVGLGLAVLLAGALTGCSSTHRQRNVVIVEEARGGFIVEQAPGSDTSFPEPAKQPVAEEELAAEQREPGTEESVERTPEDVEPAPETIAVIVGDGSFRDPVFAPRLEQQLLERGYQLAGPHEATRRVRVEVGVRKVMDLGADRALVDGHAEVTFQEATGQILDRALIHKRSGADGTEPMARDQVLDELAADIAGRIAAALARLDEQHADLTQPGAESAKGVLKVGREPVKKGA